MSRICVNLTFDIETEQAIRRMWQRIADIGITVRGLIGYRPHMTLAVYEVTDIVEYETSIVAIATATKPFVIRLESLGIFPEVGAAFLAPRMSQALFSLHRSVIDTLDGPGKPSVIDELLLPDRWTPHCTLAGRLTSGQLLRVIEICHRYWAPICGQADGIGMRIHPAHVDHCWHPFSDESLV